MLVYDSEGCAGFSNVISVTEIMGNEPTIAMDGDANLCDGSVLTLLASEADNYLWSTGEETASIEVTESGSPVHRTRFSWRCMMHHLKTRSCRMM